MTLGTLHSLCVEMDRIMSFFFVCFVLCVFCLFELDTRLLLMQKLQVLASRKGAHKHTWGDTSGGAEGGGVS